MPIVGNLTRTFCPGVKWGDLENLPLNKIIDSFSLRIKKWFIDPPRYLPGWKKKGIEGNTGFVELILSCVIIDLLSQYYYGERKSKRDIFKKYLKKQFPTFKKKVSIQYFPDLKNLADVFYHGFRCSVMHAGMLPEYCRISGTGKLIRIDVWHRKQNLQEVVVDPHALILKIEKNFDNYIKELKNPNQKKLRKKFANKFCNATGKKFKMKI